MPKTTVAARPLESGAEPLWREPTQQRSRERVDAILEAAAELIAERGAGELPMRELAARAGVPIGTIYQFFPDRNAILARLIAGYFERMDQQVEQRFADASDVDDVLTATDDLIAFLHRALADDPALVDIWTGVQASKAVRHLDLESSRRNAQRVFQAVRPLVGREHADEQLRTACFMICDLHGATMRTALGMPRAEGDRLMREFAAMVRAYMLTLVDPESADSRARRSR